MAKQPYIPLYTGDYLKDTRMLPLSVRGAWVDLMIFMWESKDRGVLVYTLPEYAMMMSCSLDDANFAIGLLEQKGVCDYELLPNGMIKLTSRRMVRDIKVSKSRSEAGKAGAAARFANDFAKAKTHTNSDNDIDNDNENKIEELRKIFQPKVSREPLLDPDNFYTTGQQAFEDIQQNERAVENLLRVVRREGYAACDEVTLMKAVRSFITTEAAKPDFTNRPRDEIKKHLVNWIRVKAKTINNYA